ncbi:hypothetical protein MNBD_GAMMA12-1655 [hydrothermal vent metagenome]|uniref:Uncharacterized protein n=1 Tax=hydrothermal vent metagenome TaxID=652676 RepID=A0A3B0XRW2_9ZZZZ
MGLLFVVEGDENAKGMYVDISMKLHSTIMLTARNSSSQSFPLVRRLSQYWCDVLYKPNEIDQLIWELKRIYDSMQIEEVKDLISLCAEALKQKLGIEVISD